MGVLFTVAQFVAMSAAILGGVHLTAAKQIQHAEARTHQRCGVLWTPRLYLPAAALPHVAGFSHWWGDHFIVCGVTASEVKDWQAQASRIATRCEVERCDEPKDTP